MKKPFTLKGWHVLLILIGFFGSVIAANVAFMTAAVRSFPGEETRNPFEQGVKYNEKLAAKAEQEQLGWSAEITDVALAGGAATIVVRVKDNHGGNILGLTMDGAMRRPTFDGEDRTVSWRRLENGDFVATAIDVAPGLWELAATAEGVNGERFSLTSRLVIK